MLRESPPRNPALDFAIGMCGLWLSAGFLWDSWAHLHVGVETFFTPYHAIFYAAMVGAAIAFSVAAFANHRRGYRFPNLVPQAYRRALIGIPVFFLGGFGDLIWHSFFGVENRIEAVTSPTHLIIGFGVVLVMSGPIRSALASRSTILTLRAQLPFLFSLAAIIEFAHLGMSYAFDPSAARADAPPPEIATSPNYLLDVALVLYKTGTGIMIVIITSLVNMAFALYAASRMRLAFGALTIFFVLGDMMISAALTNDRPLLLIHVAMALVAGLVGDVVFFRGRSSTIALSRLQVLRTAAVLMPLAYYGTFFALTISLEGTWWNWSLVMGSIVWSMLAGYGLTFLMSEPVPLVPHEEGDTLRSLASGDVAAETKKSLALS